MTDIHKKNIMHMTGVMANTLKQKTMKRSAFAHIINLASLVHGLAQRAVKISCALKQAKTHILYG